jgi:hypothetical protein
MAHRPWVTTHSQTEFADRLYRDRCDQADPVGVQFDVGDRFTGGGEGDLSPDQPWPTGARFGGVHVGSVARPETGKLARGLAARLPGRGFYLHRQGPAQVSPQIMPVTVRGRSSGRSGQPRASRPDQMRPFVAQN